MARNGVADTLVRESMVPLGAILRTEELQRRPWRAPDYATENRALSALVQALADSPGTILQTLAETILDVCHADSAGMSLLANEDRNFEWTAIAGAWKPHLGGGTPRDFGPCGDVLDRNEALLFTHWERRYPYLAVATPLAEEGLLVPFYVDGKAVGTIWAITHSDTRQFDLEDLRLLESLGRFASAAYQAVQLRHADNARRAALNVMEDAIEARRTVDRLNEELSTSEQRLRDIIAALPAAIYTTDAEGRITYYNKAAVALAGREPQIGSDQWCVTSKLHWPDGRPMPHDQCPMAIALKENRPISGVEAVAERPDGTCVPFMPFPTPLHDPAGKLIGGVNMLVDISARKQVEQKERAQKQILEMVATGKPLHEILDTVMLFIEAQEPGMRCGILLLAEDGKHFRRGSGPRLPEAYHSGFDGVRVTPPYLGPCGEAAHRSTSILVPDIANDTRYSQEWRSLMLSCGLRAARSTPIRGFDRRVLGSLAMYFDRPRDPNLTNEELVEMATSLAGIAVERDRAETSLRKQLQDMQRLHAFSRKLLMHDDVDAMMREVLSAVAELMGVGKVSVQICDGRNPPLRLVEAIGFDRAFIEQLQSVDVNGFTTCAAALRRRERVIVEDFESAPEFADLAQVARLYSFKAALSTPLLDRQGAVVAMLTTYFDRPYRPTDRELRLLDVYAELAARQIERKRHIEHREMLMNELNHRVKNTLATVQSIASQTLRTAASPADGRDAIESRLVALSKAHDVLTREHWEGADIQELISDAMAPYFSGSHACRLQTAGAQIRVVPKAALALSMALHELATNAVKYGALSNEAGCVRIEWQVVSNGRRAFRLRWSESDGPPVSAPRRRGFGSRLIERGLAHDLAGEVQLDFRPQGLVCAIEAPLAEVVGGGEEL